MKNRSGQINVNGKFMNPNDKETQALINLATKETIGLWCKNFIYDNIFSNEGTE
jgi:hypothetical protein